MAEIVTSQWIPPNTRYRAYWESGTHLVLFSLPLPLSAQLILISVRDVTLVTALHLLKLDTSHVCLF